MSRLFTPRPGPKGREVAKVEAKKKGVVRVGKEYEEEVKKTLAAINSLKTSEKVHFFLILFNLFFLL